MMQIQKYAVPHTGKGYLNFFFLNMHPADRVLRSRYDADMGVLFLWIARSGHFNIQDLVRREFRIVGTDQYFSSEFADGYINSFEIEGETFHLFEVDQ